MNTNSYDDADSLAARSTVTSLVNPALGHAVATMEHLRVPPDVAIRELCSFLTIAVIKLHHTNGVRRSGIAEYFRLVSDGVADGSCPIPGDDTPPPNQPANDPLPDDLLQVQEILAPLMRDELLAAMRRCGGIAAMRAPKPQQRAGAWAAITQASMEALFTVLSLQGLSNEQCAQRIYALADHLAAPEMTPGQRPPGPRH